MDLTIFNQKGVIKMKTYKFVEPEETRKQLCELFVMALNRPANQIEARVINWISECEYETRGVIVDIFQEIVEKKYHQ